MTNYTDVLKEISIDPNAAIEFLNNELSMPNIPFPTMGGEVFWNELAEFNGWRLQQNMITQHARILRPDNVRVAWGTVNGMYKALDRFVSSIKKDRYTPSTSGSLDSMEKLKKLKELLDMGAITQEEFDNKKAQLINSI